MWNVVPCSTQQCRLVTDGGSNLNSLNEKFIQLAVADVSSMNGLFLVTSRHISRCAGQKGSYYDQLALRYKIACARVLMEAISSLEMKAWIRDSIITIAIFLAQDDVISPHFGSRNDVLTVPDPSRRP